MLSSPESAPSSPRPLSPGAPAADGRSKSPSDDAPLMEGRRYSRDSHVVHDGVVGSDSDGEDTGAAEVVAAVAPHFPTPAPAPAPASGNASDVTLPTVFNPGGSIAPGGILGAGSEEEGAGSPKSEGVVAVVRDVAAAAIARGGDGNEKDPLLGGGGGGASSATGATISADPPATLPRDYTPAPASSGSRGVFGAVLKLVGIGRTDRASSASPVASPAPAAVVGAGGGVNPGGRFKDADAPAKPASRVWSLFGKKKDSEVSLLPAAAAYDDRGLGFGGLGDGFDSIANAGNYPAFVLPTVKVVASAPVPGSITPELAQKAREAVAKTTAPVTPDPDYKIKCGIAILAYISTGKKEVSDSAVGAMYAELSKPLRDLLEGDLQTAVAVANAVRQKALEGRATGDLAADNINAAFAAAIARGGDGVGSVAALVTSRYGGPAAGTGLVATGAAASDSALAVTVSDGVVRDAAAAAVAKGGAGGMSKKHADTVHSRDGSADYVLSNALHAFSTSFAIFG